METTVRITEILAGGYLAIGVCAALVVAGVALAQIEKLAGSSSEFLVITATIMAVSAITILAWPWLVYRIFRALKREGQQWGSGKSSRDQRGS